MALLETDPAKVAAGVAEAHAVIALRLQELAFSTDCEEYADRRVVQGFPNCESCKALREMQEAIRLHQPLPK